MKIGNHLFETEHQDNWNPVLFYQHKGCQLLLTCVTQRLYQFAHNSHQLDTSWTPHN